MRKIDSIVSIAAVFIASYSNFTTASNEPSEEDIIGAVHLQFDKVIAQTIDMVGERAIDIAPELHTVKKLGCTKAIDKGGYNCDVEIDASKLFEGRMSEIKSIRFLNTGGEWVAILTD